MLEQCSCHSRRNSRSVRNISATPCSRQYNYPSFLMRMHTEASRQPSTTAQHPTSSTSPMQHHQPPPSSQQQTPRRAPSPPGDRVSSAADAMLRLSSSLPLRSPSDMDSMTAGEYDSEDSQCMQSGMRQTRKQRQFIPEFKKDDQYWNKRKKNNEAAKRSREKRRINDIQMGQRIMELNQEKDELQREIDALKRKFGLPLDVIFEDESNGAIHGPCATPSPKHSPSPHRELKLPPIIPTTIAQKLVEKKQPYSIHVPTLTSALLMPTSAPDAPVSRPFCTKPSIVYNNHQTSFPPSLLPLNALYSKDAHSLPQFVPQVAAFPLQPHMQLAQDEAVPVVQPRSPGSGNSSPPCLKMSEVSDSTHNEESSGDESVRKRPRFSAEIPLNLCKKEPDQAGGRRKQTRKGMPLKLWHKTYTDDQELSGDENSINEPFSMHEQPPSVKHESTSAEEGRSEEGCPGEKRVRNNIAAKRCRINRKAVTELRLVQSSLLESENLQLKTELQGLAQEISGLKDLLVKKQEAEARGETFQPPPLEDLVPPTDKSTTESW